MGSRITWNRRDIPHPSRDRRCSSSTRPSHSGQVAVVAMGQVPPTTPTSTTPITITTWAINCIPFRRSLEEEVSVELSAVILGITLQIRSRIRYLVQVKKWSRQRDIITTKRSCKIGLQITTTRTARMKNSKIKFCSLPHPLISNWITSTTSDSITYLINKKQ